MYGGFGGQVAEVNLTLHNEELPELEKVIFVAELVDVL
jgi:hypothetical protein